MKKTWKWNYAAVLVAETLAITGFALSMPVIPLFLADEIGITDQSRLKIWTGIIQSSASVALAVFAPVWGRLADIYSRRAMLMRAMFGGAVIVSLMSLVNAPWQLLILRTAQGCLTGTVAAASVLTVGIVPQVSLTMSLGLLQTGIYVGNSLGPLAGGLITDFRGHRAAFLGTGAILLVAALIVLRGVKEDTHHAAPAERACGKGKLKREGFLGDLKLLASTPDIMLLLSVSFLFQMANTTANPILPLFLREISTDGRYIGSYTGLVLGLGAAAGALGAIVSGKFCLRLGYWKTMLVCLAGGCAGVAPQAFAGSLPQLALMHLVPSMFLGGIAPALQALLATHTDHDHQGRVFGLNTSVSSTGAALGPLIGSAAAMLNYRAVFPVTALFLCLPLVILLRRIRTLE
ncbi:MAG: MFS transporter [Spirochaetaceae bacterium]|jgi:DHA1 family multidrug resistance protein-like MFS transporter|nr:MFS transporter [Spirochaetaceae bacterium]